MPCCAPNTGCTGSRTSPPGTNRAGATRHSRPWRSCRSSPGPKTRAWTCARSTSRPSAPAALEGSTCRSRRPRSAPSTCPPGSPPSARANAPRPRTGSTPSGSSPRAWPPGGRKRSSGSGRKPGGEEGTRLRQPHQELRVPAQAFRPRPPHRVHPPGPGRSARRGPGRVHRGLAGEGWKRGIMEALHKKWAPP